RLLGDDAHVRRTRQDDPLRDPLPRGGRRVRGPCGADGARPGRRRRPDDGDQGPGGNANDPRHAAGGEPHVARAPARRRRGGRPRGGDRPALHRLRRGDPRTGRALPTDARHRDRRCRLPGGLPRADPGGRRRGGRRMTYVRFEVQRMLRNRRFFAFSLGFPLVLYFLIAGPNRNEHNLGGTGIDAPLYFMIGLAAFGAMNSVISGGARISVERTAGWTRQLRLTPLSPRSYLATKILVAYLAASITILVLAVAGTILGVRLSAGEWIVTVGLLLVGLL